MLNYTVKRGFYHEGVYFTRENAADVKQLPRELRNELIAQGTIEEHDERPSADEPAAPATKGKEK